MTATNWSKFRTQARQAFKQGRYDDALDAVLAFDVYCDEYGWPDWWADMQRIGYDASFAKDRERVR